MKPNQPANLDQPTIKSQLESWLREGHTAEDILAQARHNWPDLTEKEIINHISACTQTSVDAIGHPASTKNIPIDPLSDLHRIHRRRASHIRKVEAALNADTPPISLHNLYRGLLRDHESSCYKLLALSSDDKRLSPIQHENKIPKSTSCDVQHTIQLRRKCKQLEKQFEKETSPSSNGLLNTMLSWFVGFFLLFMASSSSSTRTPPAFLYTVSKPATNFATSPVSKGDHHKDSDHGGRQRTAQLFALSAENHQTLLQRTTHNSSRPPCSTRG